MPEPRFSGSSTLQLSYFRHKTVPRRSPSPSIVTRPPRDAPVGPGGACCRRGSSTRSAPSPATSPTLRTSVPPMSLLWAPKTCSTRTRTDERVLLPCFSRSLSGLLRRPLRWIRLRNPFSFSAASISGRAVSAVRPHTQSRVVPIQDIVEDLAVVLRRVAHMIAPHQLVPTVHVDMVFCNRNGSCRASWSTAPRHPFGAALPACPSQPAGVSPALYPRVLLAAVAPVWVPPQSRRR